MLLPCEWNASLFKGYLHHTYILRWKNDKRVKEQSLLSKGEMPCRVKVTESRREKWAVRGGYPIGVTGKSLRARDQEF